MKVSSIIILKWKFTLFNDWFVIITQIFDKPYILVFYILFNIISKNGKKYLLIHTHWNTFKLLSMKGWRGGGKYWEEGMEAVYLRDILWCERLSLEFCVSLFPCNLSTHHIQLRKIYRQSIHNNQWILFIYIMYTFILTV